MALKEGWLWKEGHGSMGKQSWRRRWFILESGTLEYFESPESVSRLGQVIAAADQFDPLFMVLGGIGSLLAGLFGVARFFRK